MVEQHSKPAFRALYGYKHLGWWIFTKKNRTTMWFLYLLRPFGPAEWTTNHIYSISHSITSLPIPSTIVYHNLLSQQYTITYQSTLPYTVWTHILIYHSTSSPRLLTPTTCIIFQISNNLLFTINILATNNSIFAGSLPENNSLFFICILANNSVLAGILPANNLFPYY